MLLIILFTIFKTYIYIYIYFCFQIEVETVDRTGTFLGSLWESRSNVALILLEGGLAKLQTSFGTDRIPDIHLLAQAEQSAKKHKLKVSLTTCILLELSLVLILLIVFPFLKVWESYVEGEEVQNGQTTTRKQEEFKVIWIFDQLNKYLIDDHKVVTYLVHALR